MMLELAQDFADALAALPAAHPRRRLLARLGEALDRDAGFLARHPTALFQCLWNRCWWADGPGRWRHAANPATGAADAVARWAGRAVGGRRPALHGLLERWRAEKERATPGFRWLRAVRPLDGVGLALVGHPKHLKGVDVSPDGTRVLSVGGDPWVGLWDAVTGRLLRRFYLGGRAASAAKFSPDGSWFGALSYHGRATGAWHTRSRWPRAVRQDELERFLFDEPANPGRFAVVRVPGGTEVRDDAGRTLAAVAAELWHSDAAGRVWAGRAGRELAIFRLEGEW